jgi:hypothetical protein
MSFAKFKLANGEFAVLTLTEPWATLVVMGAKEWETRSWSTSYRGLLLIHAAKNMPRYAQAACLSEPFESVLLGAGFKFDIHPDSIGGKSAAHFGFNLGSIIGAVDLVDTRATDSLASDLRKLDTPRARQELAFGNYDYNRRAFRLENPRRFERPIPVKGALGIWALTGEHAEHAREQLAAVTP